MEVEVHTPPNLNSCTVNPSSGEALKTQFIVSCTYENGHYMFELYSVKDGLEVLLDKGVKLKDLPFLLSPGAKVKVKMIDDYRFSDFKEVAVSVRPLLSATDVNNLDNEIESKYFDRKSENTIGRLMDAKKFDAVLQATDSLIVELQNAGKSDEAKDITKKYQIKTLEYLKMIPVENSDRGKQISAVVAKIVSEHISKPDPYIAALGTSICKEAAKKDEDRLKSERFPQTFADEIIEKTKILTQCSQASSTPNLEIMKIEDITDPPTPFPLLDIPVIFENYPDYIDDQNVSKFKYNFEIASNNLIDICLINSKSLEMTMVGEEDAHSVRYDFFNVTVLKEFGTLIPSSRIESQGVILIPSEDLAQPNFEIMMSMCTSTKNPFWWTQQDEVQTSVAIIQFNVDENIVNKFTKPYLINFEVNKPSPSIEMHEASTPSKPNETMSQDEYDFEKISMYRIDVSKGQGFTVEFSGLNENDILDVSITDLYKPTYQEFREIAKKVTKENNTIRQSQISNYDTWYYLGTLPTSATGNEMKYKFSVYTSTCYSWNSATRRWNIACESSRTSSMKRIECRCYHSSTIAGRIVNNKVRKEETVLVIFELEVQASIIIFISVAVAFFLYCVLLSCLSVYSKSEFAGRNVYFVCDVPSYYRYGYLLIVKTANKMDAGTTSNITVKLYGKKSESKEHVLNYPDPQKRLLQKNQEDWFFLATEHHLGDIEKIDIWFDSIGYRPTWYCSKIEVFDIQENKYYLFEINKRFEILREEKTMYTGYPRNPVEKTTKKKVFSVFKKFSDAFHGPHMWNITYKDPTFSRIKRLTLMLSIFMTAYTVSLFLYGCPRLQNSDSLAYTTEYGIHTYVVLITVGCFVITFGVHFPIVWFFRHSGPSKLDDGTIEIRKLLHDVNFLCWCIVAFNITLSITILIVFGFWVPHITSLLWLTTIIVSLVVYIFLLENIVRLIYNWIMKRETRVYYILNQVKSVIANIELQRSMLYKKFGRDLLRPFLSHLYEPINNVKIKERRYWAETREKVLEIMEDLIMITIYVILLYLVILKDKDSLSYLSHIEVGELVQGIHSRTIRLEDVQVKKELEEYVYDTLIFSEQSTQWYDKFVTKNPGMTIDNVNKYIGISRLRQHRTKNDTCKIVVEMNFIADVCYPAYSASPEHRDFSESWLDNQYSDKFARMDEIWKYRKTLAAGTLGFVGKFDYYPGGGYISTLGRTMKNSIINANYLFRNNWIDRRTRCIFIEFLLYSSNSNLFNFVSIWFEISATGYIRRKFHVDTVKLLFIKEETGMMVVIIFIAFLIIVTILAIKIAYRIVRKKRLIFKDVWHLVDVVIILMSVICICLYAERSELVKRFLSRIETSRHNEFINYFHLLYAETTLTVLAAILVFIATLRLWKLLRFMLIIKIVEKTLLLAIIPLLCLLLCQMVMTMCFVVTGILLFNDRSYHFQSTRDAFASLLRLSLNLLSNFDIEVINSPLAYFYYSAYMIICIVYTAVYMTIITICYAEAQLYYSKKQEYTVKDYVRGQYMYYSELSKIMWKNVRLRAGDEETSQVGCVYPKSDEHRYANCLTIPSNRMKAMSLISKCVIRNMRRAGDEEISNEDADLIKRTVVDLFRKNSNQTYIFYMGNDENNKVKFVDDETLVKMQKIVTLLLRKDTQEMDEDKQMEVYERIIENNQHELNDMVENLNALLVSVKNINIDEDNV